MKKYLWSATGIVVLVLLAAKIGLLRTLFGRPPIDVTQVHAVFLQAPIASAEGKALADWYRRTFGLKTLYRDPVWHEFSLQSGSKFAISYFTPTDSPVQKQKLMVSFSVPDLRSAVREMQQHQVTFYTPPSQATPVTEGPTFRWAFFQDLDGNWIQLAEQK